MRMDLAPESSTPASVTLSLDRPLLFRTRAMHDLADTDERPFDESGAPEALRARVPMEMVRCPYNDARKDHPRMNLSALRQMMGSWADALDEMGRFGAAYRRWASADEMSLVDVCRLGHVLEVLPSYLALRANAPADRLEMPVLAAVMHKVAIGLTFSAQVLFYRRLDGSAVDRGGEPLDAQILGLVAELGILRGEDEACAGPPARIAESVSALCAPRHTAPPRLIARDELDAVFRYALASLAETVGTLVLSSEKLALLHAIRDVLSHHDDHPSAERWSARARRLIRRSEVPSFSTRSTEHPGLQLAHTAALRAPGERRHLWAQAAALVGDGIDARREHALRALWHDDDDTAWSLQVEVDATLADLPLGRDRHALRAALEPPVAIWHRASARYLDLMAGLDAEIGAALGHPTGTSREHIRRFVDPLGLDPLEVFRA